jgi:hypothetical protein
VFAVLSEIELGLFDDRGWSVHDRDVYWSDWLQYHHR